MSRAPAKPVQMALLVIGHQRMLLPADKAMKAAEILQHAVAVRIDWEEYTQIYEVEKEPLEVQFSLVRPAQIRMPHGEPAPASAKPRLLR